MCGNMRHRRRWGASMFKCRRNRLRRGAYPATSDGERDSVQVRMLYVGGAHNGHGPEFRQRARRGSFVAEEDSLFWVRRHAQGAPMAGAVPGLRVARQELLREVPRAQAQRAHVRRRERRQDLPSHKSLTTSLSI